MIRVSTASSKMASIKCSVVIGNFTLQWIEL
jgi:hypothetical protein